VTVGRRRALKVLAGAAAAGGACAQGASRAEASSPHAEVPEDAVGMLFDTTLCIGCKACVSACAEANDLEPDTLRSDGLWQMPLTLNPQTKNIIQLYRSEDGAEQSFVKRQCMHCVDPSCVSGCPFGALYKGEQGIVAWNGDLCIGCRFCEVACPFEVPRFEWNRFNPQIVKCQLCDHRLPTGAEPGCTEVCPTGAVIFGRRTDLLEAAHARLERSPDRYHEQRVYGEHEAGGTQVLYLSHVPFSAIGLPTLGAESLPTYASRYHSWLYAYMAFPIVLYGLLVAFIKRNWRAHDEHVKEEEDRGGLRDQL
jgi:formate dehydrogenase beta subunit